VVLGAAGVGGYAVEQRRDRQATVSDETGTISVTVPRDWDGAVARTMWQPPNAPGDFPALSVGSSSDWADVDAHAEGVFVGILPGTKLPDRIPGHPECESEQGTVDATIDGDPSRTVVYTDCPDGVVVERVVQVAANRLLWVQIRSEDRATANAVLDQIDTSGI
jgi:hypothetical protein